MLLIFHMDVALYFHEATMTLDFKVCYKSVTSVKLPEIGNVWISVTQVMS